MKVVLVSWHFFFFHISDDFDIVEADALRFRLWLASEICLSLLIVESDSLRIVQLTT